MLVFTTEQRLLVEGKTLSKPVGAMTGSTAADTPTAVGKRAGDCLPKGTRELSGIKRMFYASTGVLVADVHLVGIFLFIKVCLKNISKS